MHKFNFSIYHDDGSIEILGNKEGYPRMSGVIPAPDINTKSEQERKYIHDGACDQITIQGYLIVTKKLIRNTAFDRHDQKTTLKVYYRPCRNKTEMEQVHSDILKIIEKRRNEKH